MVWSVFRLGELGKAEEMKEKKEKRLNLLRLKIQALEHENESLEQRLIYNDILIENLETEISKLHPASKRKLK